MADARREAIAREFVNRWLDGNDGYDICAWDESRIEEAVSMMIAWQAASARPEVGGSMESIPVNPIAGDAVQLAAKLLQSYGHDSIASDLLSAIAASERKAVAEEREAKDGAYHERDCVVALVVAMAKLLGWPVWYATHVGEWEDDWRNIIFVKLPTGQVSWHIHDSEVSLFNNLPESVEPWDGHTTEEKYTRIAAAIRGRS